MLKKIVIGIALVVVCVYGGIWVFAAVLHSKFDSREWPQNLGVLANAPKLYPERDDSPAAIELVKLATPLSINLTPAERKNNLRGGYEDLKKSFSDYVTAQLEQASDQSAAPPADVASFFSTHQADIDRVRDHILTAGPIQFQMHVRLGLEAPLPNLLGYMSLARVFTARALAKAANHDATAWDDLHAVWLLDRELWNRPELISQLIALAGTRMVNAAAVKMPLPQPAWLEELQKRDYRRDFARSFQAEASGWKVMFANELQRNRLKTALTYPYIDACLIDGTEQMRIETTRMSMQTGCDVSKVPPVTITEWNSLAKIAFPNFGAAWQRIYRFQAEREATDKALALRRGETPSTLSACMDGKWIVDANRVKFDRAIPINTGTKYPLEYAVTR